MGSMDEEPVEATDAEPRAPAAQAGSLLASLDAAEAAVDAIAQLQLDELADGELEQLLRRLRRPVTQLEGLRARAAAAQQRRRLAQRGPATVDGTLAEHRRALGDQQRLAPGEVGRLLDAGRAAGDSTATGRAVRDGRIGVAHARIIGRVLASLFGAERAAIEAELVELAERLDPVAFGRAARTLQARIQPEVLAGTQRRQRFERRFRATDTEDGGFAFSGLLYGTAAETARTAVQAFRRPDAAGEHRTPEQRGADAFEQLCAVALAAGEAPTRHGERPQVLVTITAEQLALLDQQPDQVFGVFAGSGQPIAGPELRHLLHDSSLIRVVLDAASVPTEVSTTVRTVPAGLWRALLIRDGGCTWPGCDAPAAWCDVAHAITAFADDGRLSLDNAMLLCRRHHRRYDASSMRVRIDGSCVTYPDLDPVPAGDHGPVAEVAGVNGDGPASDTGPDVARPDRPAPDGGSPTLDLEQPDDPRGGLIPP